MADVEAPVRRARGGGGAARRAERSSVSFETAKFIQRNIPNFEILNDEALEIIEANAETVLWEIGVNFVNNPEALERWKAAGAEVEGERVHIPRGLARQLCATAPASYTQHARNPERSVDQRLMALGLLPGMVLKLVRKAPLGDPLAIEFAGQVVSLRLTEAQTIIIDVAADCPIQRPRPQA